MILRNIITNEQFMRRVLPFIKPAYFEGIYRTLFNEVGKFVGKYNKLPSAEAFKIELEENNRLNEEQFVTAMDLIPQMFSNDQSDEQWMMA